MNFDKMTNSELLAYFLMSRDNLVSIKRAMQENEGIDLQELLDIEQKTYEEYLAKDVCYKLPIRANIYLMMTSLLRYYCGSKNELDRMIYHNVMRLRPIINYITDHYKEKIYIDTMDFRSLGSYLDKLCEDIFSSIK